MPWLALLLTLPLVLADDEAAEVPAEVEGVPETSDEPAPAEDAATTPAAEPILIHLDIALPSALDGLDQAAGELSQEPTLELGDLKELARDHALLRGRFGLRPRLAWTGWAGDSGWGMRGGLALRHRWWSLLPMGPQWLGESTLSASLAFAGARGPEASLSSLAGAWLGPVALLLGPRLAWDRTSYTDGPQLESGLTLGPLVSLSAELGPIALQAGGGPGWLLAGQRSAEQLPLRAELLGMAGLGLQRGVIQWTLRGQGRHTEAGTLLEASLGLSLRLE